MSQDLRSRFNNMNMYDDRQAPRGSRGHRNDGSSRGSSASHSNSHSGGGGPITIPKCTSILKKDLPYQNQTFISRPGMVQDMRLGDKIRLMSNFITLKPNARNIEPMKLHQYDIEILVNKKKEKKRERTSALFWRFFEENRRIFPDMHMFAYNDVNMLWSKVPLKIKSGQYDIRLLDKNRREVARMVIKYVGMIEFSENAQLAGDRDMTVSIIDSVVSQRARCPLSADGPDFVACRNGVYSRYFRTNNPDVRLRIPMGSGLEAWAGIHFAAKLQLQMGPVANIDLCHTVYHEPNRSLLRIIADIVKNHSVSDDEFEEFKRSIHHQGMDESNRTYFNDLLKGTMVTVKIGSRIKNFRFTKLSTRAADAERFRNDHGQMVSIAEHYMISQNRILEFPSLPCVEGPPLGGHKKQRQLFPLEFVSLANEPQKYRGPISSSLLLHMIRGTAHKANDRFETVKTLALEGHPDGCAPVVQKDRWLDEFNLDVGTEFINVDATILPPPTLVYGNSKYHDENHFGNWKTVENKQFRTVLSNRCPKTEAVKFIVPSIITVQNPRVAAVADVPIDMAHFHCLMEAVEGFGQPIWRPENGSRSLPGCVYTGTHHQAWGSDSLKNQLVSIKNHIENREDFKVDGIKIVPLIIFIFANRCTTVMTKYNIASDYAIIKQLCDGELGMNCQGILSKTFRTITKDPTECSTAHNVAYKILAKIGTTHFQLEQGGKHKNWTKLTNKEEPTLVLGIDVTHPGFTDRFIGGIAASSVASIVGNVDIAVSKFGESVRIQQCGEERIVKLDEPIIERIVAFTTNTGTEPAHIVLYRDGVSESEFKRTLYEEKQSIIRACAQLRSDYRPTITYIVVTKRHHTRFNALRVEDTEGEAGNVKPGTLVENTICSKNYFDFYLASQFGPLGTSRPTHYYVLDDEWAPSNAFWQTITFALCYNYAATPKSISIPCIVQYAHLCAKRAKDRLHGIEEIKRDRQEDFNLNNYEQYAKVIEQMKPHKNLDGILYC